MSIMCMTVLFFALEAPVTKTNSLCVLTHLKIKHFLILIPNNENVCVVFSSLNIYIQYNTRYTIMFNFSPKIAVPEIQCFRI